jgi:Skp family chaperone for outer membrane proteins
MKIKILFLALFVFAATMMVQAQGFQHRTVEERVKRVVDTLTIVFKFDKAVQDQTSAVFTDYYKATDKLREGLPDGERPGRAQMEKLSTERDEKLKMVLTEGQFKKFKDEIEPALRPRRRQG